MNTKKRLSRRDFLIQSTPIAAAFFMFPYQKQWGLRQVYNQDFSEAIDNLGRITTYSVTMRTAPSEKADAIRTIPRDTVISITQTVIGDSASAYNKIWYEIDGEGFAHSGFIQPVKSQINPIEKNIPENGLLAEVTVPLTNGILSPSWKNSVVYRLYYGSVYWINRVVVDNDDNYWYRILDEEGYLFYANATHLRIITAKDLSPISPELPIEAKRIEVHLAEQKVIAYENDAPVFMTRAATGARFQTGNFSTPQGQFVTHRKRPTRHMSDPLANSYDLPGVPWVCYLNDNGVAFHGTYWHNDFGAPRSHGCINLSNDAAKWLYRWTTPSVPIQQNYLAAETGTRVDIW